MGSLVALQLGDSKGTRTLVPAIPPGTGAVHLYPWGATSWRDPASGSGCDLRSVVALSLGNSIPPCWSCQSWTPLDPVFRGHTPPLPAWGLSEGIKPMESLFPSSAEKPTCFRNKDPPWNHLRFSQHPECRLFRNRQQLCLHVPACTSLPVTPTSWSPARPGAALLPAHS